MDLTVVSYASCLMNGVERGREDTKTAKNLEKTSKKFLTKAICCDKINEFESSERLNRIVCTL